VQKVAPEGGASHLPSLAPAAIVQLPVQQSPSRAHTSPGWIQYETPSVHLPFSQVSEQQSEFTLHVLPEVLQDVFKGTHRLPVHLPPQHCASAVQALLSEMQAAAAHLLLSQRKLQQSVPAEQASLVAAQVVITDAQVLVLVSQMPEQHSVPPLQAALYALHTAPVPPPPDMPPALIPPEFAPPDDEPAPELEPPTPPLPAFCPKPPMPVPVPAEPAAAPPLAPVPSPPLPFAPVPFAPVPSAPVPFAPVPSPPLPVSEPPEFPSGPPSPFSEPADPPALFDPLEPHATPNQVPTNKMAVTALNLDIESPWRERRQPMSGGFRNSDMRRPRPGPSNTARERSAVIPRRPETHRAGSHIGKYKVT
jgi:hypothetical protein